MAKKNVSTTAPVNPPPVPDRPPSDEEIAALLGKGYPAFQAVAAYGGKAVAEWKRYTAKSPWVLKVSMGKRSLFYARLDEGALLVTVLLAERATEAALAGGVRASLHEAIRSATVYPEGRPVVTRVRKPGDWRGVEELIALKVETAKPAARKRATASAVKTTEVVKATKTTKTAKTKTTRAVKQAR